MAPSRSGGSPGIRVPLLGVHVKRPDRGSAAWYGGLGLMAALEVIEWPVALVVGVSHALASSTHDPEVREAAQGAETGS